MEWRDKDAEGKIDKDKERARERVREREREIEYVRKGSANWTLLNDKRCVPQCTFHMATNSLDGTKKGILQTGRLHVLNIFAHTLRTQDV